MKRIVAIVAAAVMAMAGVAGADLVATSVQATENATDVVLLNGGNVPSASASGQLSVVGVPYANTSLSAQAVDNTIAASVQANWLAADEGTTLTLAAGVSVTYQYQVASDGPISIDWTPVVNLALGQGNFTIPSNGLAGYQLTVTPIGEDYYSLDAVGMIQLGDDSPMEFGDYSFDFYGQDFRAGDFIYVQFDLSLSAGTNGNWAQDGFLTGQVSITPTTGNLLPMGVAASIPEPATAGLLVLGGAIFAVGFYRRRRVA